MMRIIQWLFGVPIERLVDYIEVLPYTENREEIEFWERVAFWKNYIY